MIAETKNCFNIRSGAIVGNQSHLTKISQLSTGNTRCKLDIQCCPDAQKGPKIEQTLILPVIGIGFGVRIRCLEGLKRFRYARQNHSHLLAAADGLGAADGCTKFEHDISSCAVVSRIDGDWVNNLRHARR